ncbi:GNAT family N-acetyltransferase [Psychrobacillus sp. INOP01]|nr:GNAT family N-acetyltransferase [Psychrobacillus sp. INOP01]
MGYELLRDKGYGKQLLDSIEEIARENRCNHINIFLFKYRVRI